MNGASWFGVTNGSYNSFVNSLNDSVLLEQTNDSVILDENVLAFPINSSLLTSYESPVQIIVYTLFTDPNETIRTIWFDAMPNNYLYRFFMLVVTFDSINLIFSGLLVFVCASQIILRRKKK